MAKIAIDENLKGKELYRFLVENKSQLIAQKKALPKIADVISFNPSYFNVKNGVASKAEGEDIPQDATSLRVKVVANTSMWVDSYMDVLLRDSAAKSIKERKGMIPHLHDHMYTMDAEVGDVQSIYYQDISLRELGLNKAGSAQALVFETDIKKAYNEVVFNKYKMKKVRQHSIGLSYGRIELAINDEESEKEYDFWTKYYDQLINPEAVDDKGYFWVVSEYKLLENSCVLFGANILTPTLDAKNDTSDPPLESTDHSPSLKSEAFDLSKAIQETVFIV